MSFYLISFCILQGTKYGTFQIYCIQNTAETLYLLSYFSQNLNSYLIMWNAKINILKYKCITCLLAKIRSKASRSSFSVNNFASSLCASLTLSLWLLSTTNTTAIKKNKNIHLVTCLISVSGLNILMLYYGESTIIIFTGRLPIIGAPSNN